MGYHHTCTHRQVKKKRLTKGFCVSYSFCCFPVLILFLIGFAGYFDAVLYKDVHLGIEPSTATPNMFSWYDKFFWRL